MESGKRLAFTHGRRGYLHHAVRDGGNTVLHAHASAPAHARAQARLGMSMPIVFLVVVLVGALSAVVVLVTIMQLRAWLHALRARSELEASATGGDVVLLRGRLVV